LLAIRGTTIEDLEFLSWQKACLIALLEGDSKKLPARIAAAETAIVARMHTVVTEPDAPIER
jgi:hypothetical protein